MSLQELKKNLLDFLKDYDNKNDIISDSDIVDFQNMIIDYDNNNNTDYYSSLEDYLNIYSFDNFKNFFIKDFDTLGDLIESTANVEDNEADNYKLDVYNCLSNVYKSDLIDFIENCLLDKKELNK